VADYNWEDHWQNVERGVAGREEEVVSLALTLHSVFDGTGWSTGELDCWCGTFDESDNETLHPSPETNCWRLAAAIILEMR
jgi:hypothetical protein